MSGYPLGDIRPETFTQRIRDFFVAHAGQWVRATQLEAIGGRQAWRTRVSDARRAYGLTIENRVRTVTRADGTCYRVSEYRYVPRVTSWREEATNSPDGLTAVVEGRLF